jgi:hypothetical protein
MNIEDLLQFIAIPDNFAKVILLLLLIFYTLFSLVLAFQIFTFNRLMEQEGFALFFRIIAILHAIISFILLILVVFSL